MLDNKGFELKEKIYENEDVEVFRGIDLLTGKAIAYKRVRNQTEHKVYSELLTKEYQLMQLIDSPYVNKALTLIDEMDLVLVSEFSEGTLLKELIGDKSVSIQEKIELSIELFKAIESIHYYRILHKDINPSNIVWNRKTKELTILDFNISEQAQSQKIEFVSPKHLQGTLSYISPEQTGRMNRMLDYRSDYYSAGMTLYELFTGLLPFESSDRAEVIHQQIAILPKSPHEINGGVSVVVSKIILKLIEKNSEKRYQSTEGILADLINCQEGKITGEDFQAGKGDVLKQLHISQKVYGRDLEITRLLSLFKRAEAGAFEHCFIKGYSGVGKTTLIRELYAPITRGAGYFLSGKFDQYNSSLPYSAIIKSIEDFVQLLLIEGDDRIEAWRQRLTIALGDSLEVLTQFVPELILIVGEQKTPIELSGVEAQNRFNESLQKFFVTITDDAHPIVLFLDDLQWIDSASLKLVKSFFENQQLKHFYFIGAYRGNEVTEGHRLSLLLRSLVDEGNIINELTLQPLKRADLLDLFNDTFGSLDNATYVVEKIIEKTKGNAFFIKQLLYHFYEKKCLQYDGDEYKWSFDENCFEQEKVSENVADFLVKQFKQMDDAFIEILKVASSLGNTFKLKMVLKMLGKNADDFAQYLSILIEENYILTLGFDWYAFSHDQIQQAAYGMMNEEEQCRYHLLAAQVIEKYYGTEKSEEAIFEIAGHYSKAVNNYKDFDNPRAVFIYLKKAGDIAMRNIAHEDALGYYRNAQLISGPLAWVDYYYEQVELSNHIVKAQYMLGDFEALDSTVALTKEHIKNMRDMATLFETQIQSLMARQSYERGLTVMIEALNGFGMDVSLEVAPEAYQLGFERLAKLVNGRSIESLITLPEMVERDYLNEMEMLTGVVPLLFNAAPQLLPLVVLEMACISIEKGNCKYSAFGYAFLGTLLCGNFGDVKSGVAYGELAIGLIDRLDAVSEIPKVYMVVAQHVLHYKEHLSKIIEMEEEGFNKGIDLGDYTYAGFAGHGYCFNYYLAGNELSKTQRIFESYSKNFEEINQGTQNLFQHIYIQTIENMRVEQDQPWLMSGSWFDEAKELPALVEKGHHTALFVYYFNKVQLCYLFNKMQEALEAVEKMEAYLAGGIGLMQGSIYHQYAGLIKLALYDTMSEDEKQARSLEIQAHIDHLENLSESINYEHRLNSVLAERARVEGDYANARVLYEKALVQVQESAYLREEALYRELMCSFYEQIGNQELASFYHQSAYACYERWGAIQKLEYCSIEDSSKIAVRNNMSLYTLHSVNTAFDSAQHIDMHSILKFSQIMAKEIVYEELLKKLLYILLENAGAQRATIINYTQEGKVVIAENHTEKEFEMLLVDSIDAFEQLPHKVIRYAYNGKKIVRLDRAVSEKLFMDDPYILDHNIHSVLCFPLMSKGEILGLIYLENNLVDGAFSSERTEFLSLLSSQISISIENAMMYQHLEALVEKRTNDLAIKNEELNTLNGRLRDLSVTDGLTSLFNRRKLDEMLSYESAKANRYQTYFGVILLDIDRFKLINDNYGHMVGDQVLIHLAAILKENTREVDTVGRWGGEEFLIICPQMDLSHVRMLAEKLRSLIETYDFNGIGQRTASFGVVEYRNNEAIKDVIKRADDCLYKAKDSGRNTVISEDGL